MKPSESNPGKILVIFHYLGSSGRYESRSKGFSDLPELARYLQTPGVVWDWAEVKGLPGDGATRRFRATDLLALANGDGSSLMPRDSSTPERPGAN